MPRNQQSPAYPVDRVQARIEEIVADWPPLTPEQKTVLWLALAPAREAIAELLRQRAKTANVPKGGA